MYSEKRLCKETLQQLRCTMKNISSVESMILEKRPAKEVYYQLLAAKGGLKKIEEKLFPEMIKTDLNARINRLLGDGRLSPEHAETLTHIQSQINTCTVEELLNLVLAQREVEEQFLNFLLNN